MLFRRRKMYPAANTFGNFRFKSSQKERRWKISFGIALNFKGRSTKSDRFENNTISLNFKPTQSIFHTHTIYDGQIDFWSAIIFWAGPVIFLSSWIN